MNFVLSLLIIIAFAVGNTFKIPVYIIHQEVSILDLVSILILIYNISFNRPKVKEKLIKNKPILYSLVIFIVVTLLSLLFAAHKYEFVAILIGFSYICRFLLYSSLVLLLSPKISLLPPSITTVILGLGQYLFFPDLRSLAANNWDPHYYRVVGPFLDPGFTGLIILFGLLWVTLHNIKYQKILWITFYICLALTYSRSTYLAYLVAMALVSIKKRSPAFFVKIFIFAILTIFLLPKPGGEGVKLERTSTIMARIINWQNTLVIASDHPWFGVGFNTYRYAQREYKFLSDDNWQSNHAGAGADSSLLFVTATTGIVGLTLYIFYLSKLIHLSDMYMYIIPLLFHSLFLNSLFYPAILFLLAIIANSPRADKQSSLLSS